MNIYYVLGIVFLGIVAWVVYSSWRDKSRNTQPIEIDFNSEVPVPYGECKLAQDQIGCRFFQRLAVTDGRIELFQFPQQHNGEGMTFNEVDTAFAELAKDPLNAVHPFPAHLVPYYLNGVLNIPSDHEGQNIVFAGTKWDSQHEGQFFPGVGPDRRGSLIEKTFGRESQTRFNKNYVFAVHRPTVVVPVGLLGPNAQVRKTVVVA